MLGENSVSVEPHLYRSCRLTDAWMLDSGPSISVLLRNTQIDLGLYYYNEMASGVDAAREIEWGGLAETILLFVNSAYSFIIFYLHIL